MSKPDRPYGVGRAAKLWERIYYRVTIPFLVRRIDRTWRKLERTSSLPSQHALQACLCVYINWLDWLVPNTEKGLPIYRWCWPDSIWDARHGAYDWNWTLPRLGFGYLAEVWGERSRWLRITIGTVTYDAMRTDDPSHWVLWRIGEQAETLGFFSSMMACYEKALADSAVKSQSEIAA